MITIYSVSSHFFVHTLEYARPVRCSLAFRSMSSGYFVTFVVLVRSTRSEWKGFYGVQLNKWEGSFICDEAINFDAFNRYWGRDQ